MRTERTEKKAIAEMKVHPAAALFPMMSDVELNALAADITKNGLEHPIVVLVEGRASIGGDERYDLYEVRLRGGQILDGRNRFEACRRAGVEPELCAIDSDDPVAYVISANIHRRHLDASQRAIIAAKLVTLVKGENQHAPQGAPSQERAAKLMNVGRRTVQRARVVLDKGTPELVQAVQTGAVPIKAAAVVAKLAKSEQKKIVDKGPAAIKAKAKEKPVEAPEDSIGVPTTGPTTWAHLPVAPLPTEAQWRVLRVQLFTFIGLSEQRMNPKSKSKYACVLRDLQSRLAEVANNPVQSDLFAGKVTPVTTHAAQARGPRTIQ